jgi:uncharacterized protein
MNCPLDNTQLEITDRNGIEIDYCPKCRGIWLDRGELDKIIERTETMYTPSKDYYERSGRQQEYHKGRKKKSFFNDLFDF